MRKQTFSIPMLPPCPDALRNSHKRKPRAEETQWKDFIVVKWAEMGRPTFHSIRITLTFSFPDKDTRDPVECVATGSKLVGDAIKGLFIPDCCPDHITGWSFLFQFDNNPRTTVIIEEDRRRTAAATRPSCSLYETCLAPLCPVDHPSLTGVWYPGEDICRSRTFGNLSWVKAQRKIAGCASRRDRYFSLEMLKINCIIKKGITGLDPDAVEAAQIKRWFQEHPEKKEWSEDERENRRQRMLNLNRKMALKMPLQKRGRTRF